jgi:sugar-specific transcriptional regulator TrmB
MKSIISKLMELGLSEYEAKGYLSLLRESPSTAYEIATLSGVPTSKVYEVLKKLIEKGVISVVDKGKTKKYIPIEPADFLNKQKSKTEMIVESLKNQLPHIGDEGGLSSIWNIVDYDYLIDRARGMIANSSRTVLISIWKEEFELIEDNIREALRRDVKIAIIHFGSSKIRIGQLYQHPIEDTVYQEKGGRGIVIVADLKEVLMGTIFKYGRIEGAWSRNRGFITMAEDYIKHDIYIMKIVRRYDRLLKERFGNRYEKLRDVFKDEEVI